MGQRFFRSGICRISERARRACLILLLTLFSLSVSVTAEEVRPIRIGATYISYPNDTIQHFRDTAKVIGHALHRPTDFRLFEVRELEDAIKNGQVDLVCTGAGFFRRLEPYGLRVLATEVSPRMPDPDKTTGTTFIVLDERTDLKSVADLKGKRLAAITPESFQGYQIGMGEIFRSTGASKLERFFSHTVFVGSANGSDMPKVLQAVQNGEVDVGFVNACFAVEIVLNAHPSLKRTADDRHVALENTAGAAGDRHFFEDGDRGPCFGGSDRGTQPGNSGTNDKDIEFGIVCRR